MLFCCCQPFDTADWVSRSIPTPLYEKSGSLHNSLLDFREIIVITEKLVGLSYRVVATTDMSFFMS